MLTTRRALRIAAPSAACGGAASTRTASSSPPPPSCSRLVTARARACVRACVSECACLCGARTHSRTHTHTRQDCELRTEAVRYVSAVWVAGAGADATLSRCRVGGAGTIFYMMLHCRPQHCVPAPPRLVVCDGAMQNVALPPALRLHSAAMQCSARALPRRRRRSVTGAAGHRRRHIIL